MTTLSKEVIEKYLSPYFFETGTSNGEAVELALQVGFEKVFTVEIDEQLYKQNCVKFEKEIGEGKVFMFLGDTFNLMPQIIEQYIDKQCTFWLDAHQDFGPGGIKRCPLIEELEHIGLKKDMNHKILIDDRRMFGQWWGTGISEELVVTKLKELNENYKIGYENGIIPNDIICASL